MNRIDLRNFQSGAAALVRTTALFQRHGIRCLLLHLKPGEEIPEHRTPGPITVQCLEGEGTFASGDEEITLTPGILIIVAPGAPHRVAAKADTLLLVTLREEPRKEETRKETA